MNEVSTANASNNESSQSPFGLMSYASPMIASYFLLGPTFNILPAIYAKYFHLDLKSVALVVLLARIFDAVTDPAVGYLADKHRKAGGSRKTWVAAGGLCCLASAYFLLSPPPNPGFSYYLIGSLFFFLSFTLMEIPHITWGGELSTDYSARTKVYGYRSACIYIGFILWSGYPLLPFSETNEFTPETLHGIAVTAVIVMAISLAFSIKYAPSGNLISSHKKVSLGAIIQSVKGNKPFQILLAGLLVCGVGVGMWQGVLFIYLDSYLGLGEKFAIIQLLSNCSALAAIPLWKHFSTSYKKSTLWSICIFIFFSLILGCFGLVPVMDGFLYLF